MVGAVVLQVGFTALFIAYSFQEARKKLRRNCTEYPVLSNIASSPGNRAYIYCYVHPNRRNHRQYSFCLRRDGWPGYVGLCGLFVLCTNMAQRRVTWLTRPTMLRLDQAASVFCVLTS